MLAGETLRGRSPFPVRRKMRNLGKFWRSASQHTVLGGKDMDESRSTDPSPAEQVEPSDRSLLVRLKGGQQQAATDLYLRYAQRLRSLVRSRC